MQLHLQQSQDEKEFKKKKKIKKTKKKLKRQEKEEASLVALGGAKTWMVHSTNSFLHYDFSLCCFVHKF